MSGLPLSAIVHACGGVPGLADCLDDLRFAAEIVVVATEAQGVPATGPNVLTAVSEKDALAEASEEWVLVLDADMRIPAPLHDEIAAAIGAGGADSFTIPVRNLVGGRGVENGWLGALAPRSAPRLFRRGGAAAPARALTTALDRQVGRGVSGLLRRLDAETTVRARELARDGDAGTLAQAKRAVWLRFFESYVRRRGYRDGRYGVAVAVCAALDPILAHLKAVLEEMPARRQQEGRG